MKQLLATSFVVASGCVAAAPVLYDNGTVLTSGNLSVLSASDSTFGFGAFTGAGLALADNFSVAGPSWNVESLDFYGYQTNASGFTFTSVTWSILSGMNPNTANVVASGTTSVTNAGLVGYRVTSTTLTNTSRAIYRINADITDMTLGAGSYFLTWALTGSNASGPFVPPTVTATGNAYQSINSASFVGITDGSSGRTLDLPFGINGTLAATVPEPDSIALVLTAFAALGGSASLRRLGARRQHV